MSDKPILFSAPMVRALLAGTKTQTRRVIRGVPMFSAGYDGQWRPHVLPPGGAMPDAWSWWEGPSHGPSMYHHQKLSIAKDDRLYVREHWRTQSKAYDDLAPSDMDADYPVIYEADADWSQNKTVGRFRQGMHMPRWASRITLTVTNVRVQRLQDISDEDALAEGCKAIREFCYVFDSTAYGRSGLCHSSPVIAYSILWDEINGPGSWDANPWVAAYTFTVRLGNIDQVAA